MFEIPCGNVSGNFTVGYKDFWYVGADDLKEGHRVTEEVYFHAFRCAGFFGIKVGKTNYGPPIMTFPSENEQYLIEEALAIFHKIKQPAEGISTNMPLAMLTILGNTTDTIISAAKKLELPLEEIVKEATAGS